jgi:hypothetical protein
MPKTMSFDSMASRYRRWLMDFGATRRFAAGVSVPLGSAHARPPRLRDELRGFLVRLTA